MVLLTNQTLMATNATTSLQVLIPFAVQAAASFVVKSRSQLVNHPQVTPGLLKHSQCSTYPLLYMLGYLRH